MKKIIIVDYGLGNVRSAEQSLKRAAEENCFKINVKISKNFKDINESTHIILPGQGAFFSCMKGLKDMPGMIDALSENVLIKKKPFLGICVGMQLLAETSFENGNHNGLGWIGGQIKKIPNRNLKLPHMGWNNVIIKKTNDLIKEDPQNNFYFVHSYYFDCKFSDNEIATTKYGLSFSSIIAKENIYGTQFHPEKSSTQGLRVLNNFLNL